MKKVKKKDLQHDENYLVFVSLNWSPSGYDICRYDVGELISQSNGENVMEFCQDIFELPQLD